MFDNVQEVLCEVSQIVNSTTSDFWKQFQKLKHKHVAKRFLVHFFVTHLKIKVQVPILK